MKFGRCETAVALTSFFIPEPHNNCGLFSVPAPSSYCQVSDGVFYFLPRLLSLRQGRKSQPADPGRRIARDVATCRLHSNAFAANLGDGSQRAGAVARADCAALAGLFAAPQRLRAP